MLRQSYINIYIYIYIYIYKKTKILAKGPNPRVPHLVFLLELGSEDHCATPQKLPDSHPSSSCWT